MKRNLAPISTLVRELIPVVGSFAPAAIGGVLTFDTGTANFDPGVPPADVITGGTSGATALATAVTNTAGTLDYDGQTGDFTVGEIVTGGTSGAVGEVASDADGGTDGTLTLIGIVGVFQNNETLVGDVTGAAVVDGTLAATGGTLTLTAIVGTFQNNEVITGGGATGSASVDGTVAYSTNAPTAKKGLGWTVAWTSPGVYTVTFTDGFNSCVSAKALLQLATADDKHCQIGTIDLAARTMIIRIWDKSSIAARDLEAADANNRIHFRVWFRASAAKPEYG